MQALTALGMPGVWTWNFGEAFGHHYLDSVAMNHNASAAATRPAATPPRRRVRRVLDASDDDHGVVPARARRPREFTWSARDNVNYTQTGALAALDYAARNAQGDAAQLLPKGWNSWRKGVDEAPYAFVIPEDQGDRARVAQMVARLLGQKIEVCARADARSSLKEGRFPAGTYVVRLDQPYRNYAVDLLTPAALPEGRRRALRRRLVGAARALSPRRPFPWPIPR